MSTINFKLPKKMNIGFTGIFSCLISIFIAQVPVANFSFSPNPACQGSAVQFTDLSSNSPTAWSYTVRAGIGPGPGGGNQILTTQNPTVLLTAPGVYTVTLVATNSNGASTPFTQTIQVLQGPTAQVIPGNQNSCIGGLPLAINISNIGTGGGSYTYSWSTGSTTTGIVVQPSITTVYSCVITASNGCSIVRNATVNITTPIVNLSSSPFSLCPGSTATITAQGQNPGPFTYNWSTGSTASSLTTSLSGVYNVTVTNGNNCTGTNSYTLGSSSTLSLIAFSTPSMLCAGNTATLRVQGGATYTWSNGASMPNVTVNPSTSTNFTVIGASGTCTGVATVSLNVSTIPTISIVSNPNSLCSGASATLSASGASNYTWIPLGITSTSIVVSPSVNTTYTVRGINTGCPPRTETTSIQVLAAPMLSISSSASVICAFEDVAIAASGANTYLWNNGSTNAIILVTLSVTSTYTVTGTGANGCESTINYTQLVSTCEGINASSIDKEFLKVYPNPCQTEFHVAAPAHATVLLINQLGEEIRRVKLSTDSSISINTVGLVSGLYYLQCLSAEKSTSQKLIISK